MKNYRITIEPLNPEYANAADTMEVDGFLLGGVIDDGHLFLQVGHMNMIGIAAVIKADKMLTEAAEMAVAPEKAAARMIKAIFDDDEDDGDEADSEDDDE